MTNMTTRDIDLWTHLTNHVEAERGLLEEYSAVAEQSSSKAFSYLVNLLIEDEIRHHQLFTALAASLRPGGRSAERRPAHPVPGLRPGRPRPVLEATKKLLASEERDALELKRLQRELRDVKNTTLWSVLVDLMYRDTEKHIAILRFVRRHARRRSFL